MEEKILIEEKSIIDYVDIGEIIQSMKGYDEDNLSNTTLTATLEKWDVIGETQRQIAQASTRKSNVSIERHGDYIQCQLEFSSHTDKDLNLLWQTLEAFGSELDKIDENTTEIPMLIFSFLPELYSGDYFVTAINPIFWNIQSSKPSSINNNVLRIQFLSEQFMFYKTDAVDVKEIENAVEREDGYRLNLIIQDSIKKQKEEDAYERRRELEESLK